MAQVSNYHPMEIDMDGGGKSNKKKTIKERDAARLIETTKKQKLQMQLTTKKYRYKWTKSPGQYGFNAEATKIMRERGFYYGDRLQTTCNRNNPRPFAHTQTASWLVGPETPIDRLLVIHRTGSGKTNAMIHILGLYFSDPRAKIVVFPNSEIVKNFYSKMYKEETMYSAFVEARAQARGHANTMKYFKSTLSMDGELHKRGEMGELAAPMRPMTYSIAGGRSVFPRGGEAPKLPIFKIGYDGRNPFDNKIVLMDEVHNLIRPSVGTDKRLMTRLERLRKALFSARNSIIVGLTATPFVKNEQDGKDLLSMIKGEEYQSAATNQGFISYFNTLPTTIYPTIKPGTSAMNVVQIELQGANLKKYQQKARERKLSNNAETRRDQLFNLMGYCNMAGYYTQANRADFRKHLRKDPIDYATKLEAIAEDAFGTGKKTAILIHRRLGFNGLKQVMIGMDPHNKNKYAFVGQPKTQKEKNENPTLSEFNAPDNMRGQKIRILVLDAETFGEGIDLIGVRFFFIAHPAASFSQYKQWVGRVLRACAYDSLDSRERNVMVQMYIATLGKPDDLTADEILLELLRSETIKMERAMQDIFGVDAIDRIVLGHP
jgi:superfamily II DNA or RNA helicase